MGMVLGTLSDSGSHSASIQQHSTAGNGSNSNPDGWNTIADLRSNQEPGPSLPAQIKKPLALLLTPDSSETRSSGRVVRVGKIEDSIGLLLKSSRTHPWEASGS
jgi:hypothetical protein